MSKSKIEWTDRTWEPVQGCTKVSEGCRNCYAERLANGRMKRFYPEGFDKMVLREDKLDQPLHWRKPSLVFVCSRSDLFHPDVPFGIIYKTLMVIKNCPQHTFQILTKRPERMEIIFRHAKTDGLFFRNLWLGASVEDRENLPRIDTLRDIPAAVRFLSLEPLLKDLGEINLAGINWVILGGESGPGARPMNPDWARSVRDQCQAANVPFFFKQRGEYLDIDIAIKRKFLTTYEGTSKYQPYTRIDGYELPFVKVGKKAAGRLLDGRTWDELPEVMK